MRRVLLLGLCLLVMSVPARAQTPEEKKATVAWLRKLQTSNGGFVPAPGKAPANLVVTVSGIRALKYFGGEVPDRARCADFVRSCFDKDTGGFSALPGGKPNVFTTVAGANAAVELRLPPEAFEAAVVNYLQAKAKTFEEVRVACVGLEELGKLPTHAEDWIKEIRKAQNSDGTFGKGAGVARDTASAIVAILRMGGKVEHPEMIIKVLDAGQRKDGGFGTADAAGSDLETMYRVLRCYHRLKTKPAAADRCREFVASCRNADGGYGVTPGAPSDIAATYFASTVLEALDAK